MKKNKKRKLLSVWDDLHSLKFKAYFYGYYVNNYFINELVVDFGPMKRSAHIKFGKKDKMISSDFRATAYDSAKHKKELKTLADGRVADSSYRFVKGKKGNKRFLTKWAKILRDETAVIIAPFVERHNAEVDLTNHPLFTFKPLKKKKVKKEKSSDKKHESKGLHVL